MVKRTNRTSCARLYEAWYLCFILGLMAAVLTGCSATRESTKSARNTVEQLLISQSMERGLEVAAKLPPPNGAVVVESAGLTEDNKFAREILVEWLRQQGWHIASKDGAYLIHLRIYALGTDQALSFLGIPATQGTLIPISIPELALYKASRQHGYARFGFSLVETPSGRLITSTPVMEGDVYFNQYTVMFAFTFSSTDLAPPPPE
jgi:hypothetical protein